MPMYHLTGLAMLGSSKLLPKDKNGRRIKIGDTICYTNISKSGIKRGHKYKIVTEQTRIHKGTSWEVIDQKPAY